MDSHAWTLKSRNPCLKEAESQAHPPDPLPFLTYCRQRSKLAKPPDLQQLLKEVLKCCTFENQPFTENLFAAFPHKMKVMTIKGLQLILCKHL